MGYHFKKMNGLDFIEMMEKRGCKGSIRNKILMSGNLELVDLEKAKSLGCRVFQKPVSLNVIDELIFEIEESIPDNEQLMAV